MRSLYHTVGYVMLYTTVNATTVGEVHIEAIDQFGSSQQLQGRLLSSVGRVWNF